MASTPPVEQPEPTPDDLTQVPPTPRPTPTPTPTPTPPAKPN